MKIEELPISDEEKKLFENLKKMPMSIYAVAAFLNTDYHKIRFKLKIWEKNNFLGSLKKQGELFFYLNQNFVD
jgi:predicted transcriptional regulator